MTRFTEEQLSMIQEELRSGNFGVFAVRLGDSLEAANLVNTKKLIDAFGDLFYDALVVAYRNAK